MVNYFYTINNIVYSYHYLIIKYSLDNMYQLHIIQNNNTYFLFYKISINNKYLVK